MLTALYADKKGEIYDAPGYAPAGRVGDHIAPLKPEELIPLPEGTELMYLPGRSAVMVKKGKVTVLPGEAFAVAAMLPVGYTRTHLPAFRRLAGAPVLPLYGYTAVALYRDQMCVAAVQSEDNAKWHPYRYNTRDLAKKVAAVRRKLPQNRIVEQLANCSLKWHCCTAQNLFYHRWEAGIPVSPSCNADCFGCISLQPSECCPSPQNRIAFRPDVDEVVAVGLYHLATAPEAIISFGQGCEGEPSLAAETIAAAILQIRQTTNHGTINMNTNAGFTDGIRQIAAAGLDSMRVSMISARSETYQAYYRSNYTLEDVKASILFAKKQGVYVSLNMLCFPGLNDRPEEISAWEEFIAETDIDMIQMRNLNLDPDEFLAIMPPETETPFGVRAFLERLATRFPRVVIGSFSHNLR